MRTYRILPLMVLQLEERRWFLLVCLLTSLLLQNAYIQQHLYHQFFQYDRPPSIHKNNMWINFLSCVVQMYINYIRELLPYWFAFWTQATQAWRWLLTCTQSNRLIMLFSLILFMKAYPAPLSVMVKPKASSFFSTSISFGRPWWEIEYIQNE